MKQAFHDIVGNHLLRERLRDDILEGYLSHAYILEGSRGTGKHMLALRIAAALACECRSDPHKPLPCQSCPSCRKILGGNSPDVITVDRGDRATLGIDAIRNLRMDVHVAPNDVATKVYILEDVHLMTEPAQNAFLLTLEEPPAYVLFLLLCENSAPILETIRSRAPTMRLEPIDTDQIREHLRLVSSEAASLCGSAPTEFSEICAAANGSIGQALDLLDPKRRKPILSRREHARAFVQLCVSRHNGAATLRFLNGLGQKRDELIEQLNVILLCLRDLLLCKQTEGAPLCFFADHDEAYSLAYGFTTPALLTLCDAVTEAIDRMQMSANVRLTLTSMAVRCGLLQ